MGAGGTLLVGAPGPPERGLQGGGRCHLLALLVLCLGFLGRARALHQAEDQAPGERDAGSCAAGTVLVRCSG